MKSQCLARLFVWASGMLVVGCSGPASPAEPTSARAPALNLLFLGNSYTSVNSLPTIVQEMAASAGYAKPFVAANMPGGYTLANHLKTTQTLEMIDGGGKSGTPWDVVILQEQSQTPALAEIDAGTRRGFLDGAKGLYQRVKQKSPQARLVLYETWSRHAELWSKRPAEVRSLGANATEMQSRIRKWERAALAELNHGGKHDAAIAAVGDLWEINYRASRPIRLHADDGSHPSPAGSYLAGLVVFAIIYDASPQKISYVPPGVSQPDARVLKQLVVDYWKPTNSGRKEPPSPARP